MPHHPTIESAQAAARAYGGYILSIDYSGFYHCFDANDAINVLDGSLPATREQLAAILNDFDFRFMSLHAEDDIPVLYLREVQQAVESGQY